MQKLRGIDGEYDSDSATSNRLAHRKTIHMLEKNRHKKRAIGTLDVAFKKRFLYCILLSGTLRKRSVSTEEK